MNALSVKFGSIIRPFEVKKYLRFAFVGFSPDLRVVGERRLSIVGIEHAGATPTTTFGLLRLFS